MAPSRSRVAVWSLLLLAGVANAAVPPGFVDLRTVAPHIAIEMRYAGAQNFLGRVVRGYEAPRCLLSRAAAIALSKVQEDLAPLGLGLMVYDCYRPQRAVDDFLAWARDPSDDATRATHYPEVPKSELVKRGYIAARSGHSRGSTVDITLVPLPRPAPIPPRAPRDCRTTEGAPSPDGSLDMGTAFDCFDPRSHSGHAALSPEARRNRLVLRGAMEKRGFSPYAKEWWHFTLANEPFPTRHFDFEVR